MRIAFCCEGVGSRPWLEGLRQAVPGAVVEDWTPGMPAQDYAVVWAPPQALIDDQPGLKALFNMGAGVDALTRLTLPPAMAVIRLDDAGMGVQMAEYVSQAVVRYFRELDVTEADMRGGAWKFRKPLQREQFTVGLLGVGVLGQRVAQALQMFEFPVIGWSRTPKAIDGVRSFAGPEALPEFLTACQVLVCLLPLTAETENILDRHHLEMLPRGAYVINVARGAHLVDDALLDLLDEGHLAGATLDVFRTEPLPAEHPFWRHPKLILTPHMSARTLREKTIAQIGAKIQSLSRGESVQGVVDVVRGY